MPMPTSSDFLRPAATHPLAISMGSQNFVTMLIDPHRAVHAVSGILPVASFRIPDTRIEPTLSQAQRTKGQQRIAH